MSEQAPPAADTPAVAGPEGTPGPAQEEPPYGDPSDPYEKRFAELRSWTDRKINEVQQTRQEAAELRQWRQWAEVALTSEDPDTRRQAIEALGYAPPEEDQEDFYEEGQPPDYDDPYEALRADLESVKQSLAQRTQTEQEAAQESLVREITDARLEALEGLDEQDQNWVLAYAINALPAVREPGVPVPIPDVQGAYDAFIARETERQKRWASTKRSPYVAPGGQEATEVPDLDTHQGRVDFALRQLQDGTAT